MRIVRLLVGNPPKTAEELTKASGVTRTAVTEQLKVLIANGFVQRTTERLPGRGRPRSRYAATHNALLLLSVSSQQLLFPRIWEAIADVGGNELKGRVLKRVSRKMADHYKRRVTGRTPERRLAQMAELLREEGNLVDIEKGGDGQLIVCKRSCPFISMFEDTRTVCRLDEEILKLVIGSRIRRTTCRHDGAPCCRFVLDRRNK
jgi:predicted ArsR family transcriptional regulator